MIEFVLEYLHKLKKYIYIESNLINAIFFKKPVGQKSINIYQGKSPTELDEVASKAMCKGVHNGQRSQHVSQKMFSSVASIEVYTNVN